MLEADIPGYGELRLTNLVLDVNGTVAEGGELLLGVAERLAALSNTLTAVAVTADTQGTAASLGEALGIEVHVIESGHEALQKLALVEELDPDTVVAVGNGANDALMLRACALGICVLGPEGAARGTWESADIVVTDILDALDILAHPKRLVATLRS